MIDKKICDWLMNNADVPVRFRVARELLRDETAAKYLENELLENSVVRLWLGNLTPNDPPQHWSMEHGSFDFNLENAMSKVTKLGLHSRIAQVRDAVSLYLDRLEKSNRESANRRNVRDDFRAILTANFLVSAGLTDGFIVDFLLKSLNEIYDFVSRGLYDIYINADERARLRGVPKNWKNTEYFIKPELFDRYGFCYPLIYDIIGLSKLYTLDNRDVDIKVNSVLDYVTSDDFHANISDGYGILIVDGGKKYHGMGWDPKYPAWGDVDDYLANKNVPKLLFFAEHIVKYPAAKKTKWFADLMHSLERYRTENGTYIFPKEWMKESVGYAVQGHHMSFGESRRKKNWIEIESTFYMQLLTQST